MKKYFKIIILPIAFVFIGDIIISQVFDFIYKKNLSGESGGKINYFLKNPNYKIALIGNSRIRNCVNPKMFPEKAFNLGHGGMDQSFNSALIDIILCEKNNLSAIILQVDPTDLLEKKEMNKIQHLKYYYDKNEYVKNGINKLGKFEFCKYFFSSYKYNGLVPSIVKNFISNETTVNEGYESLKSKASDTMVVRKTSGQILEKEYSNYINASASEHLKSTIDICQKNNVELIIFTAPYYKTLNRKFKLATEYIQKTSLENGVKYFDYSSIGISDNISYWKDATHLNKDGAKIFSRILVNDSSKILNETK